MGKTGGSFMQQGLLLWCGTIVAALPALMIGHTFIVVLWLWAVKRLDVMHGAELEKIVPGDENALISASASGELDVVRYLLDQGADVHVRVRANRSEIRTALNQAERYGHDSVASLLRSRGAAE